MPVDIERWRAVFAERLRRSAVEPNDPRLAAAMAAVRAVVPPSIVDFPEPKPAQQELPGQREAVDEAIAERLEKAGISASDPRFALAASALRQRLRPLSVDGPEPAPARLELPEPLGALVEDFVATVKPPLFRAQALTESPAGQRLLALGADDKALVVVRAYGAWAALPGNTGAHALSHPALSKVISEFLRAKLEFSEDQTIELVRAATRSGFASIACSPNLAIAGAIARRVETHGLSPELRRELTILRVRMSVKQADANAEGRRLVKAVEALLAYALAGADAAPRFKPAADGWGGAISTWLAEQAPENRAPLTRLLQLASENGDKARPSKTWLKRADQILADADRGRIGALLLDAIERHEPGDPLAPANRDTLRGLIWLAAIADPVSAPRRLEAYAQMALTFSPHHLDYLSLVLGNAAILSFSLMPGTLGVAGLSRLKRRFKRPGEIKTVDKALTALAEARGMSPGELEEIGLPDYGFDADGRMSVAVGPATAVLEISEASGLNISWRSANGDIASKPSASVERDHPDGLKALKAKAKEIGETLRAQKLRVERLYLADRTWPFEVWRARYLDEPLLRGLTRRLIWSFEIESRWVAGLPNSEGVFGAAGDRLNLADAAKVRLWHPMRSEPSDVQAWRRRLRELQTTQPFKQAHREIYVVTDAEIATGDNSNRFAGHIVTQPLFRALAQTRGWNCPTFGGWDNGGGVPHKLAPDHKLKAEFEVEPIEESMRDDFKFTHMETGAVRFRNSKGEALRCADVDAVVFSEMMRDADLFVAIAGIVNDPTWADRGETRFADYWFREAAATLTETGKTRRAALADMLPGLSIASRCRLEERWLVVEGKLRTYRIHLGSANIQMEPGSEYLCIVADRTTSQGHVRLPFEGDATLSLILSKAFMLADDDKIRDKSIVSQIRRGAPAR